MLNQWLPGPKGSLKARQKRGIRRMSDLYTIGIAAPQRFAIFRPVSSTGAEMANESEYHVGSMDISAHKKTYEGFLTFSKWSFAGVMLIMIFLAAFRTH